MKIALKIFLLILLFSFTVSAQISTPVKFEKQKPYMDCSESFLLGLPNNDLLMFWAESSTRIIYMSRSTDNGNIWSEPIILVDNYYQQQNFELNAVVLTSGRILLTFKRGSYYCKYSDDNGFTWSDHIRLTSTLQEYYSGLAVLKSGQAALSFSVSPTSYPYQTPKGVYVIYSSDGITWSTRKLIDPNGFEGHFISLNDSIDAVFYHDTLNGEANIYYKTTTDDGITWSTRQTLLSDNLIERRPRVIKDTLGKIWLYYQRFDQTAFNDFYQSEIYFITSTNSGSSWSLPQKFTDYAGVDSNHTISLWNNKPVISFTSTRDYQINQNNMQIFYGTEPDESSPPALISFVQTPDSVEVYQVVNIKAFVDDNSAVDSVKLVVTLNAKEIDTLNMFDDGLHKDSLLNDQIYGIEIGGFKEGDGVLYSFLIYDDQSNIAGFKGGEINIPLDFFTPSCRLEINRFKVPFNNSGIIADVYYEGSDGGRYDEKVVLFSGGFFITGKIGNDIWAVANASASRLQDFQPGIVSSSLDDPKNQLYVVKASDPHFGESWQNYNYAVQLGAKFYDGNKDGIYNPADLNGNGTWDLNEDRPDMLGDETLWCVYNDGVPSELRAFKNMYPLGIEIKQTVFALGENLTGPIENMFFIRYIITNTGTVVQEIDSVIFCGWADPDIGDAVDDLVGCDTLLNTGYAYNAGEDHYYGVNPPAIGISLLQGALSYMRGETFIDNNSNGIFDFDIDTPLDTAFVNNGLFIGSNVFPGAKNTDQSSFIHYQASDPFLGDPNDEIETRFYSMGYTRLGGIINPCTWGLGEVRGGVDCNMVNPFYLYSGDPVTDIGWINTNPTDQRIITSTGTFKLKANEPVELWFAYVVGRGVDSLNSVTKMKEHILYANNYYRSNFTYLPSDVFDEILIPGEFALYQNYPNPFNPGTKIRYSIPTVISTEGRNLRVTLKVFDILGREITILVNEEKPAGTYEVEFSASKFASGVYFYQLKAGNYMDTKKMILVK